MKLKRVLHATRIAEVDTICGQIDGAYKENSLELDTNLNAVMHEVEMKKTRFMETIQQKMLRATLVVEILSVMISFARWDMLLLERAKIQR
jgi:hypothetical protein